MDDTCGVTEHTVVDILKFSGAGKTVSAKYIMRYFATADDQEAFGKQAKGENMTEVEEQILGTVATYDSLIFTCCTDQ